MSLSFATFLVTRHVEKPGRQLGITHDAVLTKAQAGSTCIVAKYGVR